MSKKSELNPAEYSESFTSKAISKNQQARKEKRDKAAELSAAKKERRRIITRNRRIALCVIVLAVGIVVYMVARNVVQVTSLKAEKAQLEKELSQLNDKKDALEDELEQVHTDEYVEQQARSSLKMIKPGEILYLIKHGAEEKGSSEKQVEEVMAK